MNKPIKEVYCYDTDTGEVFKYAIEEVCHSTHGPTIYTATMDQPITFDSTAIGHHFFLTREDAERAFTQRRRLRILMEERE